MERANLRAKDIDFTTNQIVVRNGEGNKDRITMLPAAAKADLAWHLESVRRRHELDLQRDAGWVELPDALARKYPTAGRESGTVQGPATGLPYPNWAAPAAVFTVLHGSVQ